MKTYVISGASRGIGLGLAKHYAAQSDATVFAGARHPDDSELARLEQQSDGRVVAFALDVDDARSIASAVEQIAKRGKIDVLLNVAGIANRQAIGDVDADDLLAVLRTNVVGPVMLTQAMLPHLAPKAKIVNMSSTLGSIAQADGDWGIAYPASKAALNMVTKQESEQVGDKAIVISLHPGWVQTDMGGSSATLTVDESVAGMTRVIDGLTAAQTGAYLTWEGKTLPW